MQKVLSLESSKYKIKITNFEGPLDLLCHLIDSNKMNIYDVNINEITDQYIEYLNKMQKMDLEITSEFLIMASNLLYIKSKKLLPRQESEEEALTEEELIAKIIEYKKYKEITNALRKMYMEEERVFKNIPEKIEFPKKELENNYTQNDIVEMYKTILNKNSVRLNKNAKNIEKIAIIENYSVGETVKTMFRELIKKSTFVFNRLFSTKTCEPQKVVTAFNGLLEMSRRDKILTEQTELFGDIYVTKKHKMQ